MTERPLSFRLYDLVLARDPAKTLEPSLLDMAEMLGATHVNVRVTMARMVKRGIIVRISQGVYRPAPGTRSMLTREALRDYPAYIAAQDDYEDCLQMGDTMAARAAKQAMLAAEREYEMSMVAGT